jgi:branched-chain amino acid transport system substrate-binding protein
MQETPPAPAPAAQGRRTRVIAAIVGILVALVAIAAVYSLSLAPAGSANVVTLGFTISLTGRYSVEGTNSLNGILTAQSWINAHGGITIGGKSYQLSLKYYDDTSTSSQIVPLYTRIITNDGANALLAPYSSALTSAAAPLADQLDRVMLSHGGSSDTIWTTAPGYRNLVMVLSPASTYLKGAIDWINTSHRSDKIAVIHESDSFSTTAAKSAIAYAGKLGINVVYNKSYTSNPQDVTPLLAAAQAAGADDLIGGGHFQDGLLIVNQLNSIGWRPKFVSLLVAVTEHSFRDQLGALSNNVTGPSQWESSVAYGPALAQSLGLNWFGPTPAEFTSLYTNVTHGLAPTYHSGEAAASALLLAKAMETANSFNTSAIRQALGQMNVMNFFGRFQINAAGLQVAHSMVVVQWQAGSLKVVWPTPVANAPLQYPYTAS